MSDEHRIAISTAWNAFRHTSGKKMVRELLKLGFDRFELSVHVTPAMIREVAAMVKDGAIQICSLHNFCPVPEGIDRDDGIWRVFQLSSPDETEREWAVAQTKKTIDWAEQLGAPAVVVHLGSVPIELRQREALRFVGAGRKEDAKMLVMEDLYERSALRGPYLESVIASMRELSGYADSSGVKLGLETRYYYGEIPSIDEFQMIFKNVSSPALGYWHDTGHAHVMEVLGLAAQTDYLAKYGDRLIGVHIHDSVGGSDHRALGKGEIDFSTILPYIKPDTEIVLEIQNRASEEDLVRSRKIASDLLEEAEKGRQQ